MDERPSRPARWRTSVNRATNALSDLKHLHREWATKLEESREVLNDLRDRRKSASKKLNDALADLVYLQSDYSCWTVPDNLSDSRLQEKLFAVQNFDFKFDIPNLTKFAIEDTLEDTSEFELERTLDLIFDGPEGTLYEAKEFDLPKGYGRD
jgi:hypothetical protein